MTFLALCAFLVVGVAAALDADQTYCVEQLYLDKNVIDQLLRGHHLSLDNADLMSFLACFGKKAGIQKDDGAIDWSKLDDYVGKALENVLEGDPTEEASAGMFFVAMVLKSVADECHTKRYGGSQGETIANFHNCVFDGLSQEFAKDKQRPDWDGVKTYCLEDTKVDESVPANVNDGSILPLHNEDINRYMQCEWKRVGALKEDGTLDWYRVGDLMCRELLKIASNPVEFIMESDFVYALKYCEKQHFVGDNPGQLVVKVQNCINKHTRFNL